ncbi:MAG: hypothetical protein ACE5HE_08800 [Phycisphaerae bacterium]
MGRELFDLAEAPASANFRLVTPSGVAVQWTLRDYDEFELTKRVATFLAARLEAGHTANGHTATSEAASAAEYSFPLSGKPGSDNDPGEHVERIACPVHPGEDLRRRVNEKGWWYSHRHGDGYCKGVPQ